MKVEKKYQLICLIIIIGIFLSCNQHKRITTLATMDYSYSGCFASGRNIITLVNDNETVYGTMIYGRNKKIKVKLNREQLDTFYLFVNQLRNTAEGGGCTTSESYRIKIGNEFIKKNIANCSQVISFNTLSKCLFKNKS